jgi:hypothetical protein
MRLSSKSDRRTGIIRTPAAGPLDCASLPVRGQAPPCDRTRRHIERLDVLNPGVASHAVRRRRVLSGPTAAWVRSRQREGEAKTCGRAGKYATTSDGQSAERTVHALERREA